MKPNFTHLLIEHLMINQKRTRIKINTSTGQVIGSDLERFDQNIKAAKKRFLAEKRHKRGRNSVESHKSISL